MCACDRRGSMSKWRSPAFGLLRYARGQAIDGEPPLGQELGLGQIGRYRQARRMRALKLEHPFIVEWCRQSGGGPWESSPARTAGSE
jgi:hypothetical protein